MSTDAQPAASSPAPSATPPSSFLDYQESQDRRDLGKPDPDPVSSPPAEIDTAKPVEQATSTEVTPEAASAAAKPRKTAEDRKRELAAEIEADLKRRHAIREEIAREEARLQALRQPPQETTKPDSAPAPAKADAFPAFDAYLHAHPDASYEDYIDARAEHRAVQAVKAQQAEQEQARVRESRTAEVRARATQFHERIHAAVKDDPQFFEGISDEITALKPLDAIRDPLTGRWTEQATPYHAIAQELIESDAAPQLMRHFSAHPEDLHRLATLTPRQMLREFGKLEAAATAKPAAAPPTPVTTFPKVSTTLGSKAAEPADGLKGAVAAGNFRAYEEEAIKRDLARR